MQVSTYKNPEPLPDVNIRLSPSEAGKLMHVIWLGIGSGPIGDNGDSLFHTLHELGYRAS